MDLKKFCKAFLDNFTKSNPKDEFGGYTVEEIEQHKQALLADLPNQFIVFTGVSTQPKGSSSVDLPSVAKAFKIDEFALRCAYEVFGGIAIEVIPLFKAQAFYWGGLVHSKYSMEGLTRFRMDKVSSIKGNETLRQDIINNSKQRGLNPETT